MVFWCHCLKLLSLSLRVDYKDSSGLESNRNSKGTLKLNLCPNKNFKIDDSALEHYH